METVSANGLTGKVNVTADDVSRKIEGFHVADEGRTGLKEEVENA